MQIPYPFRGPLSVIRHVGLTTAFMAMFFGNEAALISFGVVAIAAWLAHLQLENQALRQMLRARRTEERW